MILAWSNVYYGGYNIYIYIYIYVYPVLSIHPSFIFYLFLSSIFYWHKFMTSYFFSCLQYILVLNYLVAKIVPTLAKGSPLSYFLCLCVVSQSFFILLSTFLLSGIRYHLISYLPTLPQTPTQLFLQGGLIPFRSHCSCTIMGSMSSEKGK